MSLRLRLQIRSGSVLQSVLACRLPIRGSGRPTCESRLRALPHGKALIVSVVASPEPHWSLQEIAADFARCA
ncbi:MAG UNVERIFIED_CONTAM: hypothetical protein LVR18_27130 [Planctomycetaceae bacterium]